MSITQWRRKIGRLTAYGALAVVIIVPLVFIGLVIRAKLDPPPAMRHATATEVTGYETVSTEKKDLSGGLVVSKVFIGPVIDRPQDRIVSPGTRLDDMDRPGPPGVHWLVYGKYADGCHISVDRVAGGVTLRTADGLSDTQRDEVSRGEKLVLVAKFACGEG
ncbi:hypothetical protein ABZV58_32455 [Nocardia sp. NPDC004654]|uniref:hypothetical protein n=1 Tax=Nocardia sp. NPDC004654 TaxID=3154776 RepID=UPI0033AFFDF3